MLETDPASFEHLIEAELLNCCVRLTRRLDTLAKRQGSERRNVYLTACLRLVAGGGSILRLSLDDEEMPF